MKESALPVTISFVLRVPGRSLSLCGAERFALQNRVVVANLVGRGELYTYAITWLSSLGACGSSRILREDCCSLALRSMRGS